MKSPAFSKKTLLLFSFLLCFCFSAIAQNKTEKHMLWKVSSAKGVEGYLVGSMHLVKSGFYPLDTIFQKTLLKSNPIVFEVNLDSAKIKLPRLIYDLGLYPPGNQLKDHLSAKTYQKVMKRLKKMNLANIQRMKPWYVALMLSSSNMGNQGGTEKGIDNHFFQQAKKSGKKIVGLETAEYQIKIFDDLPEKLQVKHLNYALKNSEKNIHVIDTLTTYWKAGNAEGAHNWLNSQVSLKKYSKELYQNLIVQRNQNWRIKIEKMFKNPETPMIVVGLAHLVGPDNLINLLKKDGYTVEQM